MSRYTMSRYIGWIALGGLLSLGSISSSAVAESPAQIELKSMPVTPEEAKEQDRLVNELYSHYVDCLDNVGSEEVCYRRWRRECNALFQSAQKDFCSRLEEKMFPAPKAGDESC